MNYANCLQGNGYVVNVADVVVFWVRSNLGESRKNSSCINDLVAGLPAVALAKVGNWELVTGYWSLPLPSDTDLYHTPQ